jgi:signal peptidase I
MAQPGLAEGTPARPRPWLAVLLSLVQPGLGHFYLWRPRIAFAIWLAATVLGLLMLRGVLELPGFLGLATAVAWFLVLYSAVAWHAWRTARNNGKVQRPRWPKLALALIAYLAATSFLTDYLQEWYKRNVAEAFRIPSGSMEPTILVGDYLFVIPRHRDSVRRDLPYTFRREGTMILMRIVGLPGDTLAMRDGRFLRNSVSVAEPYVQMTGSGDYSDKEFEWQRTQVIARTKGEVYRPTTDNWGPLVVPPATAFVLGDNRHYSRDSRYTGFVPLDSVLGKPYRVYFSRDPQEGVRWKRIGHAF